MLLSLNLNAQQTDTTLVNEPTIMLSDSTQLSNATDSLAQKRSFLYRTFKQDYPNPKKAALLALVPGMGQVYNKKWWKVPLVYGAFTGIVFSINYNKERYDLYQSLYLTKVNNGDLPDSVQGTRLDNANTLKTLRNSYDKNLQLSYIGGVLVYILQGVDAFVDAHLLSFDIDEDLSLQIDPTFIPTAQNATLGLGISLQF
ncbi:MAG: DUF5683 domain-containing protein [Saprospiraceae bacterium]